MIKIKKLWNKMKKFTVEHSIVVLLIVFALVSAIRDFGNSSVKTERARNDNTFVSMKRPSVKISQTDSGIGEDRKIIKTASISIEVMNVEKAKNKIKNKIKEVKGITESFYSYDYNDKIAYDLEIRVPTSALNDVLKYIKSLGLMLHETCSVKDVGEYYKDTENRLKNLLARRDRLREMMQTKTDGLSDIIAVDRELSSVQNQIERLEKQIKKIDKDINYSRLRVKIVPEMKIKKFGMDGWKFRTSWNKAVNSLIGLTQDFIDLLIGIVVFIPIWIFIVLYFVWVKKQKKEYKKRRDFKYRQKPKGKIKGKIRRR